MRRLLLLLALIAMSATAFYDDSENAIARRPSDDVSEFIQYEINEKYIRHMSSIINAYRSDVMGGRLIIETNSQIDTKYNAWKRSADLVNSLLTLPKGMNDAGR